LDPIKENFMKNQFLKLFIIVSFLISGCKQESSKDEDSKLEHETEETIHSIKQGDVEIILIDGCEYIVYKEAEGANHAYGYMAHKGNCSNPIHCQNRL
jgi:hypothetical protein